MRVLMVTRETGADRRYGLGRSLTPIVDALAARGVPHRYVCQDDLSPQQLQWREAWLARAFTRPGLRGRADRSALLRAWVERLQVGAQAARIARADGFTHVHAHDPWIAAGVAWGLRGARMPVRWGVTEHGFGSYAEATRLDGLLQEPFTRRLLRRIERIVLARAGWVMVPTRACLGALAHDLHLLRPPSHWHSVPHARPAQSAPTAASRAAARASLGWRADEFVVLAVGRIVPLKGFETVIEACAQLALPQLRLAIAGGGDPAALQALAQARGLGGRVTFAFVDDVTPWYHAADVYVSASTTESFGLANLEALCAGLPSVCSPVGGVPEVMGEGAWLVPGDAAHLVPALRALATDPALRQHWSERARARAAAWPDAGEITQRYVDIYQAA